MGAPGVADDRWRDLETELARQPASRTAVTLPLPPPNDSPALPSAYSPALAGASEVVALVRRLADGQNRDDLVEQLDTIRAHLVVEPIRVLVVGGHGQGKSSVINALLGASVCPVGAEATTAAPMSLAHAADYRAELVIDPIGSGRLEPTRRPVDFSEAVSLGTNAMNPGNQWALREIEIGVPSPTLMRGLVLVDTPAISEVWSSESTRLLRAAASAAGVVLVTSASAELTPGELDLLRTAAALCHRVVVVVNGTNAFPQWASVVDRNQLLLEQRGVPAKVFAVAATPYWGEAGGVPPGPDAGMRALASYLEESVVLDTEHQRISKALVETFWAADRLRMRLYAERALIGDGEGIDTATTRLRKAARGAQELCSPTAAWHQALTDGLRDLRRDIDDDLRTEMARLTAETEQQVAAIGITASWDDVHLWIHHRLADAIVHVHRVRKLAMRGFCKRVADQFQHDWAQIVASLDMASEAHALLNPRLDRPVLTGTRTLADLPLPSPHPEPAASLHTPPAAPADPNLRHTATMPAPAFGAAANDPRATARAMYGNWLAVTEQFLRADTDDTLERVAGELDQRCQGRGIELHRSIVEVFTTLNVLRHLDPDMVLQRHEALESDLEQLQTLDFQLHRSDPGPKLGY